MSGATAAAGSILASSRSASVRLLEPGKIKAREAARGEPRVVQLIEGLKCLGHASESGRLASTARAASGPPASLICRFAAARIAAVCARPVDELSNAASLAESASAAGLRGPRGNRTPEPDDPVAARRLGPTGQQLERKRLRRRGQIGARGGGGQRGGVLGPAQPESGVRARGARVEGVHSP